MKYFDKPDIKKNLTIERLTFAFRIIVGVIVSILTADFFGIEFAPSTGVITLLTIDETKEDTFRRIILRILSFGYTYFFAWIVTDLFHLSTTIGFSISLSLVTLITFLLSWDITLSVNCVILIQLFLDSKPFTFNLFINESSRLLIGVITAVIVNFIFNAKRDDHEKKENKTENSKQSN